MARTATKTTAAKPKTASTATKKTTTATAATQNAELEAAKKQAAEARAAQEAQAEEIAELKKMLANMQRQLEQRNPQIVQVMADTEKVVMRFQAEIADDNVAVFGANGMYGQITGKTGTVVVPKSEWSRFYNESTRRMMDRRWLVVLSGMDDDERRRYNCAYKEGEVLDEKAFDGLLDMGRDLLAVFPALCWEHKLMVARRFITAFENDDKRAYDRDLIVALNELSKAGTEQLPKNDVRRRGMFHTVIEALNAKDAEE